MIVVLPRIIAICKIEVGADGRPAMPRPNFENNNNEKKNPIIALHVFYFGILNAICWLPSKS